MRIKSFSIKTYVYLLIAVLMVLSISSILYLYRLLDESVNAEALANRYHLTTVQYCSRIKEELTSIEKYILTNDIDISFKLNSSFYFIERNLSAISDLQQIYRHIEFKNILFRAKQKFQKLISIKAGKGIDNTAFYGKLKNYIQPFLITINQLQRLHISNHSELNTKLLAKKRQNIKNILIFFVFILFIGLFTIKRILTFITESIHAQKQAEEQLRKNASELKEANLELEEFNFMSSHDLQEPLRTMAGYCSLLKRDIGDKLPERAEEDLNFITEAAIRMQNLVQDLLSFSHVRQLNIKLEAVDLGCCVEKVVKHLEAQINETGGKVKWSELPRVQGDSTHLTLVLQNLVSNALKFRGDKSPLVKIFSLAKNDMWEITVEDNGIGIEEKYLQYIFVPFKRLHGIKKYKGSGIGLAICRKIINYSGGDIVVESEPGKGSKFKFTLKACNEKP